MRYRQHEKDSRWILASFFGHGVSDLYTAFAPQFLGKDRVLAARSCQYAEKFSSVTSELGEVELGHGHGTPRGLATQPDGVTRRRSHGGDSVQIAG